MALRQAAPLTGCGKQHLCTDTNRHLRARGRAVRDLATGGEIDRLELDEFDAPEDPIMRRAIVSSASR